MPIRNFFALIVLAASAGVLAQSSGGDFTITRYVIAGGGGDSTGGDYSLSSTIAQPLAGTQSNGGGFRLTGGFRVPLTDRTDALFRNGFE